MSIYQLALLFILWNACSVVNAFHLSMVASGAPMFRALEKGFPSVLPGIGSSSPQDVSSVLISNLAVVALKKRLKEQTHVSCDVNSSPSKILFQGLVGPVTVRGRGWQSGLGLTCRAIEATVDRCELDMGRIVSHQKLSLTTAAKGSAMVALNGNDFGNFITHPLMKVPSLAGNGQLRFLKEGASIDSDTGRITFQGTYADKTWRFVLQRDGRKGVPKALVTVEDISAASLDPENQEIARKLSEEVSAYFNDLTLELDGTFLSFRDLMVKFKANEPVVVIALGITVRKFPSPGLEF